MKKSILFTPLFLFLLCFSPQNFLVAQDAYIPDFEFAETETHATVGLMAMPPVCNTPTWPYTTNITSTSATFNWTAVSGAMSYSVQTRVPNGTWYDVPGGPFAGTSVTGTGFSPATSYEWRARANCSGGEFSPWTYSIAFTTLGSSYCYAPGWLSTINITQTTATFDWDPVSGADSYSIQWRLAGGTWYNLSGGPWTNTWVNVAGLQPGTEYEWRVKSNCGYNDYSNWSSPEWFITLGYSCSTPTWPSTSNITQTSAKFSWSAVSGANSYSVQTRLPNGTWYDAPGSPTSGTWITVNGFSPGTTYEWRVRANCSGGQYSNWTYPISFTTLGSYCSAPSWLGTTNITQTSATLDWSAASGANSYSLQYRLAGGTWYNISGGPFYDTWLTISGLQPGTAYEWRVRSNCANWEMSPWSYSASFTTLGNYYCNTPTWPSTSNITQTTATFSWSAVSGATSYSVQTRLPNGTWYDIPGGPVYSAWVTVSGFSPGTTYQWRVRSNCSGGQYSDWTYPISFTTLGNYCTAPTWLGTTNITQTSATLDWSGGSGANSYSLQYRTGGGSWWDVPGGPFYDSWHTITGLQPGTTYEWRVRSNCANWEMSPWSSPASFTTLSGYTCNTPTWPSTSNITQSSATFSWSSVSGATSYSVQTRLPNGTWYDAPGSPTYNNWITVSGLTPGTTYEWRVRANCGNGQYSNWTYPISFTTLGSYCNAPTWLGTTNITSTSAVLDWSSVSGANSYSLQYRLSGGTWYNVPGGPFYDSWYTLTGLQPGTTYEWRVKSNCANWEMSPWSYGVTFTTLGGSYCNTPTWPTTSNITSTTATFSWSAVSGAVSYSVQTRLPNGTWYDVPNGPFSSTWVTVTGFNPGTTYEWRVRANCSGGQYSNWTYPITFTTNGDSYCNAPTWLGTLNITQTTATFDWSAASGATSYSIQWRLAGGTWYNLNGGPFTNTYVNVGNLQPGTAYEWRVRSNCSNWQMSPWSSPASFTTLGGYSCGTPTWPSTSNITQTTATFSWTAVSGALNYTIQTRLPNGTWYDAPGGPFTNTTVTIGGFSPGTTYEWRVRANCSGGQHSNWTTPISFTTTGSGGGNNNNCSGATVLTVNSSCIATASTTINATPSTPAPVGDCPSLGYKDVWFKFTMPAGPDPDVTIRTTAGSLTDAVMEVYVGDSCNSMTYLDCEDDNLDGNNSTMPVINLSGNANATIWVRVWGYYGTSGTFSICVLNYTSMNYTGTIDEMEPSFETDVLENSVEIETLPETEEISIELQVSPNPASDVLNISLLQSETCRVNAVALIDLSGKIMYKQGFEYNRVNEFEESIDVSGYTPGIYILQMRTDCGIVSEKVIVAR